MTDYRLDSLSQQLFEKMVQALAAREITSTVTPFAYGPDGGREATFEGVADYGAEDSLWNGSGLIMAKYRTRTQGPMQDAQWACAELEKALRLYPRQTSSLRMPQYFIFATNVVLSSSLGGGKDQVLKILHGFAEDRRVEFDIWDYDKLRALLDRHADIRRSYMGWITPGDVLAQLGEQNPSSGRISSEEDLMQFVRGVIDKFRCWAEDKGGWRVFWDTNSKTIPESHMQLLFLAILDDYCEKAGLRLDREVETGRGPVDFAITGDRRMRVLVEMKKITHGQFWHGLRVQTPTYMRGQEVNRAIFLAIRDSDTRSMTRRWDKLKEEASAMRAETGLAIEVERIDILPKRSASNA